MDIKPNKTKTRRMKISCKYNAQQKHATNIKWHATTDSNGITLLSFKAVNSLEAYL